LALRTDHLPRQSSYAQRRNIAVVQRLPLAILGQWVLEAPAQKAQLVGVVQLFEVGGIAAELPVVLPDSACILGAPVDHLFFAVALDLLHQARRHRHSDQHHHRHHEQHRQQHGPTVAPPPRTDL
jgi:hypothetical protein